MIVGIANPYSAPWPLGAVTSVPSAAQIG